MNIGRLRCTSSRLNIANCQSDKFPHGRQALRLRFHRWGFFSSLSPQLQPPSHSTQHPTTGPTGSASSVYIVGAALPLKYTKAVWYGVQCSFRVLPTHYMFQRPLPNSAIMAHSCPECQKSFKKANHLKDVSISLSTSPSSS